MVYRRPKGVRSGHEKEISDAWLDHYYYSVGNLTNHEEALPVGLNWEILKNELLLFWTQLNIAKVIGLIHNISLFDLRTKITMTYAAIFN